MWRSIVAMPIVKVKPCESRYTETVIYFLSAHAGQESSLWNVNQWNLM